MPEVNIESLSPAPLAPEEETAVAPEETQIPEQQDTMQVGTGAALEEQAAAEDLQMQQLQEPQPVSELEKQQIRTEEAYPAAKEQARRAEELTSPELPSMDEKYYPENSFTAQYVSKSKEKAEKGGTWTKQEKDELFDRVGGFYRDNVLSMNLGEGKSVEGRLGAINQATHFRVAKLDEKGEFVLGSDGKPMYKDIPFAGTNQERRLVQMFEAGDQHVYDSGIYKLFNGEEELGNIDIGLQSMRQKIQNPVAAWFSRTETEEGGLAKFIGVMQKANPKVMPARLAYMAKKQAEAGPFSGIEGERAWGNVKDTAGFLVNIGVGGAEWLIGEGKAIVNAYNYITGTPSADVTNASANTVTATVLDNVKPEDRDDDTIETAYRRVLSGDLTPLEIQSAMDTFKEAYPNANEAELAAFFGYSPDAFTQVKRFTTESVVTGGGFVAITKKMAATERKAFMDFVREKTGDTTFTDAAGALKAAQNSDISPTDLMRMYREQRGSRKMFSDFRARTLDHELSKSSPYRNDIIQPEIDRKRTQLQELKTKLDALKGPNDRPKLQQTYLAQKAQIEKDLVDLTKKRYIPPHYRDYFVDETIANTAAALGYQAIYDAAGYNETASSIGSFLAAIGSSLPKVRRSFGETKEDFKAIWKHGIYGESAENARAGRKMMGVLRDTPKEMREEFMIFMERKAVVTEELRGIRYPENYPDASKVGKPVLDEDTVIDGFWRMSGMLSLRAVNQEIRKSSIDIQKDVGKLNEKLWDLEKNYRQERDLMNGMAKHMDALKYYRMSDDFDPGSESGIMVDTLIGFYDSNMKRLDDMEIDFKDIQEKNLNDIRSFFDGSARGDVADTLNDGDTQLSQLLNVAWERHREYNLPKDATVEQELDMLQGFYNDMASKVNSAFEQNRALTFDTEGQVETANNLFRNFLLTQRAKAYAEGNAAYNALRNSPLYKDARMDMTDVAETLIRENDSGLYFDERALSEFLPTYRRGEEGAPVESLAALKFAGQGLSSTNSTVLRRLFNEGATSYLNDLNQRGYGEALQGIFDNADLPDNASALEKFFAYKSWYDTEGAARMDADVYEDLKPRLGVDVTTFTHLMQGLGSSKNRVAWDLRDSLLGRAKDNFYDDFYAPKSERVVLEGFADDYANVRNVWEKRVKEPFEEMNSTIRSLSQDGDLAKLAPNAFESFMNATLAGKKAVYGYELKQPGGFIYEIEKMLGKPLDVTTEEGKMVQHLLNSYVTAEVSRTPGANELRRYLSTTPEGKLLVQGATPATVGKIMRGIGDTPTPLLDNLTRTDPTTGKPLFVDVNGVPLIDPKAHRLLGIDSLLTFDVAEAANAVRRVDNDLQAISDVRLRELKDANSEIRIGLEERKNIAKNFRNAPGGMGKAIVTKAQTEGGLDDLAAMRSDYIKGKVAGGMSEEKAAAYWDQTVRESTIEHIMNTVMSVGEEVPTRTFLPDGTPKIDAENVAMINPERLGEILGLRGGGLDGNNAKAMKGLLGEETYDHMKMIFDTLFDPTVRTGSLNVTGTSIPLSAESLLSRGTSFFRGVISLRWLISEAAIRKSRQSNYELTKLMLSNPKVGEEILNMLIDNKFDLDKRTPEFVDILLAQIAKNDAIQRYAAEQKGEEYIPLGAETMLREQEQQKQEEEQRLEEMQQGMTTAA